MFYASLILSLLSASVGFAGSSASWPKLDLARPDQVRLGEPVDAQLRRGIERLGQEPYTAEWLLADVSFQVNRIFTNYSGDVSGRFLELASLTSPPGQFQPPSLGPVVKQIVQYQRADGHFGLPIDLPRKMERNSTPIPMLWGNARLLVGLVTAANHFHDTNLLAAARRLGDFYVSTADVFCSGAREAELKATGTGGDGYTCCYFPAIESLALLYRANGERRYLQQADTSSGRPKCPAARVLHGLGAWAKPDAKRQTQEGVAGRPDFDPDFADEPGLIEPYLSAIPV